MDNKSQLILQILRAVNAHAVTGKKADAFLFFELIFMSETQLSGLCRSLNIIK